MQKIIKNAIQCKLCGDVIESTDRHNYVECKCGACAADGGHDYLRRSFKEKDCYIELSITEEIDNIADGLIEENMDALKELGK